jgi:hypothetical protein
MEGEEYKKFSSGFYEKVLEEDVIEEFDSDSVELLGDRIVQIAEANDPQPLLITTSNADVLPLKHSFLIRRSYVPDDEKRLFELVVYGPKDPVAWKAKLEEDSARRTESKPLGMSAQQDFMNRATKRMFEEVEKNLASPSSAPFQGLGFASMDEFRAFFEDKRRNFATKEEYNQFFIAEMKRQWEEGRARRREELVRKPPYYASQMTSMLNEQMTVHCRIVGKDKEAVYKHFEYYKSFHKMSEHMYVIDNGADDGLHVSFIYGKDNEE